MIRTGGFTLVELAVVLFILGLAAALVAPRLPSSASADLNRSADAVAALLRSIDQEAVVTKKRFRLRFLPGTGAMAVMEQRGGELVPPGDPLLSRSPLRGEVIVEEVRTASLGGVRSGELSIDVGTGGIAEFLAIHLSAGELRRTVMAYPLSGRVAIFDGYREQPL